MSSRKGGRTFSVFHKHQYNSHLCPVLGPGDGGRQVSGPEKPWAWLTIGLGKVLLHFLRCSNFQPGASKGILGAARSSNTFSTQLVRRGH